VTVADILKYSSLNVVSRAGMAEVKGVTGYWLEQHSTSQGAKPDGRPRLEGARYK